MNRACCIFVICAITAHLRAELRLIFSRKINERIRVATELTKIDHTSSKMEESDGASPKSQKEPLIEWEELKDDEDFDSCYGPASLKSCEDAIQVYEWNIERLEPGKTAHVKTSSIMKNSIKNNLFQVLTLHIIMKKVRIVNSTPFIFKTNLSWLESAQELIKTRLKATVYDEGYKRLREQRYEPANFCELNNELGNGIEMRFLCYPEIFYGGIDSDKAISMPVVPLEQEDIVDIQFMAVSAPCTNTRVNFPLLPINFYTNSLIGFSKEVDINPAFFKLNEYLRASPKYLPTKIDEALEQFMFCAFTKGQFLRESEEGRIYSRIEFKVDAYSDKFLNCFKETASKE